MAGGLDNLSAEGLGQLSSKLNEATRNLEKALKQQEQLLKNTLEVERQIVSTRVAGLAEYNDGYSRLLNAVQSEISSLNAEMFKVTEAAEDAADTAEKAAESVKQAQASSGGGGSGKKAQKGRAVSSGLDAEATDRLIDAEVRLWEAEEERLEFRKKKEKEVVDASNKLTAAREMLLGKSDDAQKARLSAIKDLELSKIMSVTEAEQEYFDIRSKMATELAQNAGLDGAGNYDRGRAQAAAALQAELVNKTNNAKALHALQKRMDAERAELEYQARLKHNGELRAEDAEAIAEMLEKRYGDEQKFQEELRKEKDKQLKDEKKAHKAESDKNRGIIAGAVGLGAGATISDRIHSLREMRDAIADDGRDQNGNEISKGTASLIVAVQALSSLAQQLESKIDEIAVYKGKIDTRLHGSSNETNFGSYWDQIVKDMTSVGAVNPYFKQEDFAKKIADLVDTGIAFDLEQRAFLATISDKIATTFEVTDGTLLRLVRIQQQDSTAGRLGMEAALNEFLNNMYENTEYLKTVASGVRTSLEEMQALMEGAAATEVEYQVQKWMGSLYSVGMSQDAVTKISTALGQIAAGQIEGLTGEGAGNLLIMAANDANLSIADILAKGLDSSSINALMQATVNYLAEIASASQDNQVVQQQLANVFGVKASDLRAATNLASKGSVGTIYSELMSYDNMLYYLNDMAGSMWQRTSMGEMMTNLWNNVQYSLAGSMSSNPISYFLYKAATLLDNTAGGIAIPAISVLGSGVDLETTVSDLMRVGALGTGILGSIGDLAAGLGNSFSGSKMLQQLGIRTGSGLAVTPRGDGSILSAGGGAKTVSESGYVGNASGSDIKSSTMQEAADSKQQLMVEAQESAEANQVDAINTTMLKIYELLDDVAHGNSYFRVKVESYGLTKAGSSSSLGGVSALGDLGNGSSVGYSTSGSGQLSAGGVNSGGSSGNINFGGWTTTM